MNNEIVKLQLKIQELDISSDKGAFKGKLFAATPSRSKPRGISSETWALSLLHATSQYGNFHLAIPRSFWALSENDLIEKAGLGEAGTSWIDVMDAFDRTDNYDGCTPKDSVHTIVDYLNRGDDVLILSATKKVSGFVPAMLSIASNPSAHIVKVWYPIVCGYGYELTPFQFGYIYGQLDAFRFEPIRKDISYGQGGYYKEDDDTNTKYPTSADNSELENAASEARALLKLVGQTLFEKEMLEIHGLVEQLSECVKHPDIEEFGTAHGGVNSIMYRLCDVLKAVTTEGHDALAAAGQDIITMPIGQPMLSLNSICDHSENASLRQHHEQLKHELQTYQQQLLSIADRLWHIGSIDLCFLCCDLSVFIEHPEVAKADTLVSSLHSIRNQLGSVAGRVEEIAEMIRQHKVIDCQPTSADSTILEGIDPVAIVAARSAEIIQGPWNQNP